MTQNTMSKAMPKALLTKNDAASSPVEYFQNKLNFETTPYAIQDMLAKKAKDWFIVDVRSASGYAESHIPTAINIPLNELTDKMAMLPKDKTIVAYCSSATCQLAPRACLMLAQKGFKVMELLGGMEGWNASSYETEPKA